LHYERADKSCAGRPGFAIYVKESKMEHTIKAVFSDVDGTLLNASHRVTPKTGEWIHKILKSGIHFVIVSARSPSGIYPIMRRNDLHCALIAYSGALIMDEERNVLYSRQIDRQTALRIEAFIREQGYDLSICILSNAVILRSQFPNKKITVLKELCGDIDESSYNAAITVLKNQQIEIA
jgi:hydroxymethylpyrimidine pyrophosphatase-like HAD family hydrolase